MRTLRLAAALAVAAAASFLPACSSNPQGGSGGGGKVKVAFVTNNPEDFWNIAEAGCRKAEADIPGVEVVFRRPNSGDPAQQKEVIDVLMQQGVKALAVSVINPELQRAYLDEIAAKVKLITVDNDAPKTGRLAYIGTDNYKAGRAVGRLVKEALPEGGTIAIFVGQTDALNALQRHQGVLDELADKPIPADINQLTLGQAGQTYGKWRLFRTFTDQPQGADRAKQNAVDAITQLESVPGGKCFIGLWAYNPPAILAAVKDKGKQGAIKIVGFDENAATLDGIRDGIISATVVQDPFQFGYQSVKLMASLVQGGAPPANPLQYVPERIVTKDGGNGRLAVEPFRQQLEEQMRKK